MKENEIRINLNETVKFKLTDYGKTLYYHRYDDFIQMSGTEFVMPHFPKEDEEGYVTMQLWDFMNLYGPYMSMGSESVIQPLEIVLCEQSNDKVTGWY